MSERDLMETEDQDPQGNDIEGALMDGLDDDPRLGHGVPEHLRGTDLDFIQMSGLTVTGDPVSDPPVPDSDLDPSVPVSFYEEGVDDVDARRTPLGTEPEPGSADEVILPKPRPLKSTSIESLKEIVADLAAGESRRTQASKPITQPPPESDPEPAESPAFSDSAQPTTGLDAPAEPDPAPAKPVPAPKASPLSALGPIPEDESPLQSTAPPQPPKPPSDPPPAKISPTPKRAETTPPASKLAEAESLLDQLEDRLATPPEDDFDIPNIPEATVPESDPPETDESVYNRPNAPARRRSKRSRSARRRLFRFAAALALLSALGAGSYYAYDTFEQQTASDSELYSHAARLAQRGQSADAANAFLAVVQRFPNSPLAPDALLMAGRAYVEAGDPDSAIALFERFRNGYPDHPKFHRATTMLALAYEATAQHEKAISLLQAPERRALDPDGYLASLRALGRAHAALGQIDEARSAYLRAASLEGNYTADEDYLDLAALYQAQAEKADDLETRRRYQTLTVDQWDFAMRSPGITESRRREIKARRDLLINELGNAALADLNAAPVAEPDSAQVLQNDEVPPDETAPPETSNDEPAQTETPNEP